MDIEEELAGDKVEKELAEDKFEALVLYFVLLAVKIPVLCQFCDRVVYDV